MPLSRTAFCYIDDDMEQFGSHSIFFKSEERRGDLFKILFVEHHVIEFRHIYMFHLRQESNDILITYRDHEFGRPASVVLKHRADHQYGPALPVDVELIEFYEWLRERLFSSQTSHPDESSSPSSPRQTYPSESCIPSLLDDSPSLPLRTLPLRQSDPTCSS
jgi:hypothetical protein